MQNRQVEKAFHHITDRVLYEALNPVTRMRRCGSVSPNKGEVEIHSRVVHGWVRMQGVFSGPRATRAHLQFL